MSMGAARDRCRTRQKPASQADQFFDRLDTNGDNFITKVKFPLR